MNRLEDVDVSGVHLVGAPANHRPFALFKSTAGRKPGELETMKLTKAEFAKRIATQLEGEISDEKLQAFAKALGIEISDTPAPKTPVAKTDPNDKEDEDDGAVRKGKNIEAAIEKAVKPFMDRIEQLEKANADAAKVALAKRVAVLKHAGYELDETVTEPEVAAIEKGHATVLKAAERAGLTKAFGSPEADEPTSGAPALQLMVSKKVTEVLGRTPISKLEEARAKQEIYRANPGLLSAIAKAERQAAGR